MGGGGRAIRSGLTGALDAPGETGRNWSQIRDRDESPRQSRRTPSTTTRGTKRSMGAPSSHRAPRTDAAHTPL